MDENDRQLLRDIVRRLDRQESLVAEIRKLVGPSGIAFPDGSLLVQTIHGTKYFIDPTDLVMAPQLVVYRQWESDVSGFILNSVNENSVFMDVGANFGYVTCLAGSRIGRQGSGCVIAVEPNPRMLALLKKNIYINWSMAPIEVHECAATAETGYVTLVVPDAHAANASVLRKGDKTARENSVIVNASTIDAISAGRKVDVLKIDVEGHEAAVLKGAKETIGRSKGISIVMEWSLNQIKSAGFSADDVLAEVKALGLRFFELSTGGATGKPGDVGAEVPLAAIRERPYANVVLRR